MNSQEAFNQAALGLLNQGEKAIRFSDGGETCVYRSEDGLKCAMGFLIPDELYSSNMEGTKASGILAEFPELDELFDSDVDGELLDELQGVHDDFDPEDWERNLKATAYRFGLEWNIIKDRDGVWKVTDA